MHPLDGPRAKVSRAYAELVTLETEKQEFAQRFPYRAIPAEIDAQGTNKVLRVNTAAPEELPLLWSVLVGEIAHDLRSALDQLVCQLACRKAKRADLPCEDTGFPIFRFGPRDRRSPRRERWPPGKKVPKSIALLTRKHRADIKRLQPYHRRNGKEQSPLWLLHEIHNADKHRRIQLVAFGAVEWETGMDLKPGFQVTLDEIAREWRPKRGVKLVNGAEVGTVAVGLAEKMGMEFDLTVEIRFALGCPSVEGRPVARTLMGITHHVNEIIESFAGDFPKSGVRIAL